MGRDGVGLVILPCAFCFNPRAPRGARPNPQDDYRPHPAFQSTRPAWGATSIESAASRASCVSIHAPRVGRDSCIFGTAVNHCCFNPRAPRGARPQIRTDHAADEHVSIHAPRVGRDCTHRERPPWCSRFNPRAPRGARPAHGDKSVLRVLFQSTRPAWGATSAHGGSGAPRGVSIHAPRVGRDSNKG